ncbi:MAG: site-2 protease family protein [Oscillatoria sp. SIO1A7]|nr:site-2 protease family protein [Oscillatoria sp. SIO1A7]
MVFWLLLLGFITYFILQQRVARLTRTPVWLLWLVLMTPAFIWVAWYQTRGASKQMPIAVAIGPFLLCLLAYWLLVYLGRRQIEKPMDSSEASADSEYQNPEETKTLSQVRLLDKNQEALLRDCFPWTVYPLHRIDYRPQSAICRGQLRAKPEMAYQKVRQNIEAQFGDRFLIIFQEDFDGKPLFILVPNPHRAETGDSANPYIASPKEQSLGKPALALALALITLFTTTVVGTQIAAVPVGDLPSNPVLLLQGLPYALALMAVLGIHELGHYFAAAFYKIPANLPYFIPFPAFLGTFGAFVRIRAPMPNRKVLFDVSIAGPLAGLLVTIPILIWGLGLSTVVDLPERGGMLSIEALNPTFSLLLTLLTKLALGSEFAADRAIELHPIAVAGYVGAIVTAFNLMPVGQLDGGHIVHAVFGQRTGAVIGQAARFLLLALSLMQPDLLFWAIFLFFIPIIDSPALNDVTELDNWRDFCGLLALGVLLLIILPAPPLVTNLLNL